MERLKAQSARDRQGADDIVECVAVELSSPGAQCSNLPRTSNANTVSADVRCCRRCYEMSLSMSTKMYHRKPLTLSTALAATGIASVTSTPYMYSVAMPARRFHRNRWYPSFNFSIRETSRDQRPNPGTTFRLPQYNGDRPIRATSLEE